jgi:hypothetical protein
VDPVLLVYGKLSINKKNWLFVGDANAGQGSASIYSIIESCWRHSVEPTLICTTPFAACRP